MKSTYYNDGEHEKRIPENETPPEGWVKGRIISCATTTGCKKINNGVVEKFLRPEESMPEGFKLGRLPDPQRARKQAETMRSKKFHHYNNGEIGIVICEGEEIPEGFRLGRLPMSDKTRQKLSDAHKGLHHNDETKAKISANSNNNRPKAYATIVERYGSMEAYNRIQSNKAFETRKQKGNLNTSVVEDNMYKQLCDTYGKKDVLRNYKSSVYPYRCDFYIRSLDKYIELNAHWTHGGKPYDKNDSECKQQLALWESKAVQSKFYAEAIKTWTIRDVEKLNCAKTNHLNYEVIY